MSILGLSDASVPSKCIKCGADNPSMAKFCSECGALQTVSLTISSEQVGDVLPEVKASAEESSSIENGQSNEIEPPFFGYVQTSTSPWNRWAQSIRTWAQSTGAIVVLVVVALAVVVIKTALTPTGNAPESSPPSSGSSSSGVSSEPAASSPDTSDPTTNLMACLKSHDDGVKSVQKLYGECAEEYVAWVETCEASGGGDKDTCLAKGADAVRGLVFANRIISGQSPPPSSFYGDSPETAAQTPDTSDPTANLMACLESHDDGVKSYVKLSGECVEEMGAWIKACQALGGGDEQTCVVKSAALINGTVAANRTMNGESPPPSSGSSSSGAQSTTPSESDSDIRDAVEGWANAFRARDADRFAAYYAPEVEQFFRKKDVSRSQIHDTYLSTFGKMNSIYAYEISDLRVVFPDGTESPLRATATYNKKWDTSQTDGKRFSGEEIERLTFEKTDEGWKIVREDELQVLRTSRQ
jgi:ketosteroid isomerase-like protein